MRKINALILIAALLGLSLSIQAQDPEKVLNMTLDECIAKALENNLGVAVAMLEPELADLAVNQANEKFFPTMSFSFRKQDTNQASYSWLDARESLNSVNTNYSTQIDQQVPTGGTFSVSLDSGVYDTNRTGTTINPRYSSTLRFDFSQPLLRNFGPKMSRREIIIAKNRLGMSEEDLKRTLQETIYSVEEAYWNLVYAMDNLQVSQQSLQLAQDLLEKNQRGVEVGTLAPIEIVSAQAQVASREADILAAEAEVKNMEDRLKNILNLAPDTPEAELIQIVPQDTPSYEKMDISLDEALSIALENRPDLQSRRIGLKNSEIDLGYARNQTLPDLRLQASYWSPGVSGTQLIYPPGLPTGDPIATIPGGVSGSFEDVFGFRYQNWSINLTLDVPINNIFSRAALAQANVNLKQARLQLENQEKTIYTDIKIAVRAVDTNFKRIQALKVARELAEKQLEAEEEKLKVGLTTNYLVLQAQRDLSSQRTQEIRAIIDYNLSLARLSRDMGVSLKEKNIKVADLLED